MTEDPIQLPSHSDGHPHEGLLPPHGRRGAPRGNRNAFKHGFYTRTIPSSVVKEFETYTFNGLQDEIAALRLLNRSAIQRAFLHSEDDLAFQDAARVVIGLTVGLNATLRTQIELDLHGGSAFDNELKAALEAVRKELCVDPVGS